MNAPADVDPALASLDDSLARFLATPLAVSDATLLAGWRPRGSLWQQLRPLLAAQAGARVRQRDVDSHRLHFWDGGAPSAPALVLLHGFGASKENWGMLAARLRRRYRLLVPDLPGFGNSGFDPGADYAAATQADRIAAWMRSIGVSRAHFAGSSMGGAIAAQVAARHPQLVDSLCLMNAAGVPAARTTLLESGLAAGVNYLAPATRGQTTRVFDICLHRRKRWLGRSLSLLMATEMSHRKPVNDFLFGHLVHSLRPTYECLNAIDTPTLVLWGDSDQVLDVTCVEVFRARIPHARAMVMPGVGHLPMIEEPALTARVLHDFWRSAK